jgi:hypothetical protein
MNFKIFKLPSVRALGLGFLYMTCVGPIRADDQAPVSQRTFSSPMEATNALVKAAKAHDRAAIQQMFGPEVTNLFTGDKVLDEKHFDGFASDLAEGCAIVPEPDGKAMLEIGSDKFPFPIPLVQTNGAWLFDTLAGEEEIINRHIGRDEYYAIGVCRAYVQAQREYAARFSSRSGTPRYARRFKSGPEKTDGLYWTSATGAGPSPLSPLVAEACLEGYNWGAGKGPRPFHGYYFKILTRQGSAAPGGKMNYVRHGQMTRGFALVAYPVRWEESGVMTFIVNQDGVVYQRSLGETTPDLAGPMEEYNPDSAWTVVKDPGITNLTANTSDDQAR